MKKFTIMVIIVMCLLNHSCSLRTSTVESTSQLQWKTADLTHEGYPLMLRFPSGIDYEKMRGEFPKLLIITHIFTKVSSNGMPEADYNDSLFGLDEAIVNLFEHNKQGQVVLVETFGGKRHYYFYVSSRVDKDSVLSLLLNKNPQNKIIASERNDTDWSFIKRYAKEFGF